MLGLEAPLWDLSGSQKMGGGMSQWTFGPTPGAAASGEPERLTGPEPLRVQRRTSLWDWQWSQLPGQEFFLVPTTLEME